MSRNSSRIPAGAVCLLTLWALLAGVRGPAAEPQPDDEPGAGLLGVTGAELLAAAPRLEVQLALAAVQAIFWFFTMRLGTPFVVEWANTWSEATRARWTTMNQATFKKSYMIDFDEAGAFTFACTFLVILTQHAMGGVLCLPSVLGVLPALASTLACHGALCEAGWEIQDYLSRWYDFVFGGPEGRARQPVPILILTTLHHAMGTLLVVPMNTYFHDSPEYHELVFLLQAAAVGALGLQQYGFTLDISKTKDLIMMKITVSLTLVIMLWSRLFRYWYVVYRLLSMLQTEAPGSKIYYGAFMVSVMMGMLNVLMLLDAVGKFTKFIVKSTPALEKKLSKRSLSTEDLSELDAVAQEALTVGFPQAFRLTKARKQWAKIRGLKNMGLLKTADAPRGPRSSS
jgi:hypothetical protein